MVKVKISDFRMPYSLGLEQVSDPLGRSNHFLCVVHGPGAELIELKLLYSVRVFLRILMPSQTSSFLQNSGRLPLTYE